MQLNISNIFVKIFCLVGMMLMFRPVLSATDSCRNVGVAGECKIFQESIQVQPMVAQQLIRLALDDNDIIFGEYTNKTVGDDTYEVTDSTGAKHIFWFDDLQDSKSDTVEHSVASAVCLLNGGRIDGKSSLCYGRLSESKLNQDLSQFGITVQCINNMNTEPYCKIQSKTLTGALRGFMYNNKQIMDPTAFKTMQIVSTDEVQEYLRDYTMLSISSYGLLMRGFQCLSMPKSYRPTGEYVARDDVLSCTVTYFDSGADKTYKQTIDFLFDDMYEHSSLTASAGRAGLICSAQGGSATSKGVCAGFSQDMCINLQNEFNIDTEWNPDAGGCIMLDSQKNAKNQKVASIAGSAGLMVLGVVSLPVSGGTSAVAIVAAIGGVITLVSTLTSEITGAIIDAKFTANLLDANKCLINQCGGAIVRDSQLFVKNKTSEQCIACATESVQRLIESVIVYNGDFTNSNANASAYLIDILYSVISGTLQPICIEEIATNIEQSPLVDIKETADTAMLVGIVLSLGSGVTGKFTKPKMTTVMDKIVNKVKNLQSAQINTAALEALAVSGRAERLFVRMETMSQTTVNALKNYKKARGWNTLTKNATRFIDDMDATESSAVDVYKTWTAHCGDSFPCDKTIDDFMSVETLNDLCVGGRI